VHKNTAFPMNLSKEFSFATFILAVLQTNEISFPYYHEFFQAQMAVIRRLPPFHLSGYHEFLLLNPRHFLLSAPLS